MMRESTIHRLEVLCRLLLAALILIATVSWYRMALASSQTPSHGHSGTTDYKAPFPHEGENLPGIIPDAYSVILFSGHSITNVSAAVGRDIEPLVGQVITPIEGMPQGLMFGMLDVSKELLEAIRRYRGVEMVEYSFKPEPAAELKLE